MNNSTYESNKAAVNQSSRKTDSELRAVIADNISALRVKAGMTQAELAEKLCYSDKAVSKWERGESLPDITVLCRISALFSVTLDYLTVDHAGEPELPVHTEESRIKPIDKLMITLLSLTGIWFFGLLAFVIIWVIGEGIKPVIFLCCLPVSAVLILIFNSIWSQPGAKRAGNYISISVFIWSILAILYAFLSIWQLFILGIPAQAALTFAIFIRFNKGGTDGGQHLR